MLRLTLDQRIATTRCRRRPACRPQPEELEGRQLMSAGDLDLSFGNGTGFVLTSPKVEHNSVGYSHDEARAIHILADGKLLVGGATSNRYDFGLVRLTPDGSLDTTFGTGGRVVTDFFGRLDQMAGMAVQGDGRIVVVGTVQSSSGKGNSTVYDFDIGLVRYDTNGSLDTAFGTGGKVITNVSTITTPDSNSYVRQDTASAVAIQPDGKIVVAGHSRTGLDSFNETDLILVRYNADGSLDTNFGSGGKVVTHVTDGRDTVNDLVIQPDGKIIVAGTLIDSSNTAFLARYDTNGVLDTSFGAGGVATVVPPGSYTARAMSIQPDGAIVIAGNFRNGTDSDIAASRLLSEGTLDPSFGVAGFVTVNLGGNQFVVDVTIQGDDKIVVVGHDQSVIGSPNSLLTRFGSDGTLDPSFGSGGLSIVSLSSGIHDQLNALALQADGKIVTAGWASVTVTSRKSTVVHSDFVVARFEADSGAAGAAASFSVEGPCTAIDSHNASVHSLPSAAEILAPTPKRRRALAWASSLDSVYRARGLIYVTP